MKEWKSQFSIEYEDFIKEMDLYYSKYPVDIARQEALLDEQNHKNAGASALEKKTWIYEMAAKECEVVLFRHCPFYFEIASGRQRNSVGSAFPPIPGIDSWLMRRDETGFLKEFQDWANPYMDQDIIDSTMYMDCAHHAMGIENVLKYGFRGLKEQAAEALKALEPTGNEFLSCVIRAEEAVMAITGKFSLKAKELLENEEDEMVRTRLERIEKAAKRCPIEPAESFYEALNTIWYVRELGNSLEALGFAVLGHVDRILEPYYRKDIECGVLTKEEAKDLIYWFTALTDARWDLNDTPYGTNTTINIGGCGREGKPVFNDITRFIIECYMDYPLVNPKLQARFSKGACEEYYEMIGALAAKGSNVLSIFNDEVLIKAHVRMGKELEDSRLYVSGGCQEPVLAETEFNSRAFCYLNPSQYLLMMLFKEKWSFFEKEGIVPIGLEDAENFEEFYRRVFYNLRLIINAITFRYNGFERRWKSYNPCPFFSSTITGCIESGRDVSLGGAKYNSSGYALSGIGTFADSMFALKKTVYEEKTISWPRMKQLLQSDFMEGKRMQGYLRNKIDKFGRDNEEMNHFTAKLYQDMAEVTSHMPNTRGGQYEASLWSFYGYENLKENTGATPDGRGKGESLSRGMNPSEITGTSLTEMIHSIEEADLSLFPASAVFYFEMPLALTKGNDKVFSDLIKYFIACGGSVFDFDVVDAESLKQARKNPSKYQNLIVRVCGFSARFVTLSPGMQEEIISRALRLV